MRQEVLVEEVKWNNQNMEHAALRIIGFYIHGLSFLGTSKWVRFASKIIPVIRGQKSNQVELNAEGFSLVFIGPRPTLIPVIEDGTVVWTAREPRLVFHDETYSNLLPSFRTMVYRINAAIAEEAQSTYRLVISKDPLVFTFPKQEYAQVKRYRGVYLQFQAH